MTKDRDMTERKLIDAIGTLIEKQGFETIGVNAVAKEAGVSKVLIYRYFNSLDELIYRYMEKNDFWINLPKPLPDGTNVKAYLKAMFREQVRQLRVDTTLKRLYRWELSTNSPLIDRLREQRELNGLRLTQSISQFGKGSQTELAAIATLTSAAVSYLTLLEENCREYNGIDIQSDAGWEQILLGINKLIDLLY